MNTPAAISSPVKQPVIRAAAYVRMSTEHQQYSTSNQMDTIREYAVRRNMEIITIYSDEGKSGLNIQGRGELARMISDVAVWFYTTGKKVKGLKKIGPGKYSYGS